MKTYTYQQVYDASMKYFDGDELSTHVFISKYALRDQNDQILELTPEDMHYRLASEFARIEKKYVNYVSEQVIFNLFDRFKYIIPQGSPMSGIGNLYKIQSISNCFSIESPHDSYGGILHTDQEQAQIMKRRGGVGFDISTIRPKGMHTANAAGTTDGIAVFMERFSGTCREVAQGGRRGALILTISVKHPQIETFIDIKRDLKKVTGANLSIRVTDEFMRAVESDSEFTLQWPIDATLMNAQVTNVVKARDIWNKMMNAAWMCAEPGILFWDTITRESSADIFADKGFKSVSVNPCVTGETLVETNAGMKTVKELSVANAVFKVKSFDEKQQCVVESNAIAFKTKDNAKILKLKLKNGKFVRLTAEHLVYTDSGWKRADKLLKTDKILSLKNDKSV